LPEKHRLVAHNFARKDDPDPEWSKAVKSHLKAVLKRAGHKLTPGKRIRLKDDQQRYEVHILTDEAEGDKAKTLVFFAVTAVDFPKYHSVPALLKDLKAGFYATVDAGTLWSGGSVQRACQPYFQRLSTHYATSVLSNVQGKVEQVRDVMASSVAKALSTVEQLEDMDEKAELFEDKSKTFFKRTEEVKVQERSKYRALTCLLAIAIIAVIAYLVFTAVVKYRQASGETGGDDSSSSSSSSSTGGDESSSSSSSGDGYDSSTPGRRLLSMRSSLLSPLSSSLPPASDAARQATREVLLRAGRMDERRTTTALPFLAPHARLAIRLQRDLQPRQSQPLQQLATEQQQQQQQSLRMDN
jgi:hypothetical protein